MRSCLGLIFSVLFFLLFIDGLLPQAQILLFSGRILVPGIALKILLLFVLMLATSLHLLSSGSLTWNKQIGNAHALLFIYLSIHCTLYISEFPADYVLLSYNSYYFFFIVLPLTFHLSVGSRSLEKSVHWIGLPLILLGCVQYFVGTSILPMAAEDGSFRVYATDFYGRQRAFSFFGSALGYGYFLSLLGSLSLLHFLRRRGLRRTPAALVLAVTTGACYTTLTRNLYMGYVFTLATAVLLARKRHSPDGTAHRRKLLFLPILYGLVAPLVFGVNTLLTLSEDHILLKADSLGMRVLAWQHYLPLWLESDLFHLLFGLGLIQNERFPLTETFVIDNSFLAVGLHIGLIGLVIWIIFMWRLWSYLLDLHLRSRSGTFVSAVTAFFSTWIATAMFNIVFVPYLVLALMAIVVSSASRLRVARQVAAAGHVALMPARRWGLETDRR